MSVDQDNEDTMQWERDLKPEYREIVDRYQQRRGFYTSLDQVAVAAMLDLEELAEMTTGPTADELEVIDYVRRGLVMGIWHPLSIRTAIERIDTDER